jgi:hypothetical protein
MQLIDFWRNLPGHWKFERVFSDQSIQVGSLHVVKETNSVYKGQEQGIYKVSQQTFFRNYKYSWEVDFLNIYGENPKQGYGLLHTLSNASRVHTHICKQDFYQFELLKTDLTSWGSVITITGPRKDLKLTTVYKRSGDDLLQ